MSQTVEFLISRAQEANEAEQPAEALRYAEEALQNDPENLEALILSGVARVKTGKFNEALEPLQRVLEGDPDSFVAPYWLSIVYRRLGNREKAEIHARRGLDNNPEEPMAYEQLGHCYLDLLRFNDAEKCFRRALEKLPNRAALHGGLGLALRGQGRTFDSVKAFLRAIEIEPRSFTARLHLAMALTDEGDATAGVECAQEAMRIRPESVQARKALAAALLADNQPQEAEQHLKTLGPTEHADADLFALSGQIKQALGQNQEAQEEYRKALILDPLHGSACVGVARGGKITDKDADFVNRIGAALSNNDLTPPRAADLHYAIGKAFDDLGKYEEALKHFDEANRLTHYIRFGDTLFDRQTQKLNDDVALQLFAPDFMDRYRGQGSMDPLPIFVVGMMRSGTTLTEQILSSHPRVGAAGEQSFWLKNRSGALLPGTPALDTEKLKLLASECCAVLRRLVPGKDRVVDKMPANYNVLPIIHLAHPNARIIHLRRHPVDTCISIYSTPNAGRIGWANDRENITFTYEEYLRLMAGWRRVIPAGRLLEIDYENLVSNTEQVTREMISFCGLEWDDACLRPEENKRHVLTPSLWQVRQPIYKTSLERWKHYEPWLGPFRRLLHSPIL